MRDCQKLEEISRNPRFWMIYRPQALLSGYFSVAMENNHLLLSGKPS